MNFLIIGDFILDTYIFGTVERVSPEAPVVEFLLDGNTQYKLGGAANVAYILDNLRDVSGYFLTKVGQEMEQLANYQLGYNNIQYMPIVFGKTCIKTRLVEATQRQQILRIAQEDGVLPVNMLQDAVEKIPKEEIDIVVISDYDKGLLCNESIKYIRKQFTGIPIVVDPKYKHWDGYSSIFDIDSDIDVVTPNHKEVARLFAVESSEVYKHPIIYAKKVVEKGIQNCIITLGSDGAVFCTDKSDCGCIPTKVRDIFDVTGAGDTFFSAIAYLWKNTTDIESTIKIANQAAGSVVEVLGNALIDLSVLSRGQ